MRRGAASSLFSEKVVENVVDKPGVQVYIHLMARVPRFYKSLGTFFISKT